MGARAPLLVALTGVLLGNAVRVAAAEPATVMISQFQFEPHELTVPPGATVVWVNHDQTVHSIATKDGKFASAGLDTDDQFSFVFERKGDYPYFCSLHPQMVGVVHVRKQ
jgi:plastocyanin